MRLGATAPIPIDIRVIAATHQPLAERIAEQRFRQDLYYRLNTLRLALPPLRERREDIPAIITPLVANCLARIGSKLPAERVLEGIMDHITAYDWPGNVRELENIAERIAVFLLSFSRVQDIRYDDLRHDCPELFEDSDTVDAGMQNVPLAERIRDAMESSQGKPGVAAKKLGVSRSTLWRWLQASSTDH